MKVLVYSFFALFMSVSAFAQRIPDGGIHKVHIDRPGMTADAEILPVKVPSRPDAGAWYYWFAGNEIRQTQGGFSGHLLNGAYHSFYEGGSPMESGSFAGGLKTGVWRSWNSGGSLKQSVSYRDGRRSGPFTVYDEAGRPRQSGSYKADLLDGPVSDYPQPDSAVVTWYRNGKAVAHRPLYKRLNIFKKRHRDSSVVLPKP